MTWERLKDLMETMPVEVLRELEGQIRRFVNERLRNSSWFESGWMPELDLSESDSAYTLEMDLPGLAREAVELEVAGNVLTVRGERKNPRAAGPEAYRYRERRFGRFERSFPLATKLQEDMATARFENGVLTVTLPKAEPPQAHRVHVEVR
jgi:HSP20 family protein